MKVVLLHGLIGIGCDHFQEQKDFLVFRLFVYLVLHLLKSDEPDSSADNQCKLARDLTQ